MSLLLRIHISYLSLLHVSPATEQTWLAYHKLGTAYAGFSYVLYGLKTRLRTKLITVIFLMQICTRRTLFPLACPANVCLRDSGTLSPLTVYLQSASLHVICSSLEGPTAKRRIRAVEHVLIHTFNKPKRLLGISRPVSYPSISLAVFHNTNRLGLIR